MEGVSEHDTRPTPSPARTADSAPEHRLAYRKEVTLTGTGMGTGLGTGEPYAAAKRDQIIGACFDEGYRHLSVWRRRRSSKVAVQQALHHGSARLALRAEAPYRAGSIPGVRSQRVCITAIPK